MTSMMTPHDAGRRIRALELVWVNPVCPKCLGRPHRLVTIDPDTGEEVSETMPEVGCPSCGQPIFREYHLVNAESRGA